MEVITLEAKARLSGKTAAKAARREESVPCVLYGHGTEPRTFTIPQLSLRKLTHTNEFHTVNVILDGVTFPCVLKDVAFHPVTDLAIHADFQVLNAKEKITIKVPVHYSGNAVGVRSGGTLATFINKVSIKCLPEFLPNFLNIDISKLKIGQSILVRTLQLPGIEIKAPMNQTMVAVVRPRTALSIEEEEEEVAVAATGETTDGEDN
ncbi:MAG: 50S ribosomal protein L25 [Bacteroidetes bacterium]|nr:50S ribosomal protein L25 [Bacteroidota bacterium]